MMKIIPIVVYIIVLIIALVSPASEGYNTFVWKLIVGQIYAIPSFLIAAALVQLYIKKKKK
ncbi:MAG: DUF4017 family protein [Kurthia sp.]|nr:DUF4017 family protein [Candidatus Kurthia equi]